MVLYKASKHGSNSGKTNCTDLQKTLNQVKGSVLLNCERKCGNFNRNARVCEDITLYTDLAHRHVVDQITTFWHHCSVQL